MAHDGSMASKVEAWIVTRIEGLAPFAGRDVEVFTGSTHQLGNQLVAQRRAGTASRLVGVGFAGARRGPPEEGEQAYEPT